jgi:hypothetical protein
MLAEEGVAYSGATNDMIFIQPLRSVQLNAPRSSVTIVGELRKQPSWEPLMNYVQPEQKRYKMPPHEGITVARFLTLANVV